MKWFSIPSLRIPKWCLWHAPLWLVLNGCSTYHPSHGLLKWCLWHAPLWLVLKWLFDLSSKSWAKRPPSLHERSQGSMMVHVLRTNNYIESIRIVLALNVHAQPSCTYQTTGCHHRVLGAPPRPDPSRWRMVGTPPRRHTLLLLSKLNMKTFNLL